MMDLLKRIKIKKIHNIIVSIIITIVFLLTYLEFTSWKNNKNVIVNISEYINLHCTNLNQENDSCLLNIDSAVNLSWDNMFIFPEWSMPEDIKNKLNLKEYNKEYVKDDTKRIIFLKDSAIIYDEDYSVYSSNIIFAYTNYPDQIIQYNSPFFYVRKIIEQGNKQTEYYYKLYPIAITADSIK